MATVNSIMPEADSAPVAFRKSVNAQGYTYFWNVATRESVWQLPEGAILLADDPIALQASSHQGDSLVPLAEDQHSSFEAQRHSDMKLRERKPENLESENFPAIIKGIESLGEGVRGQSGGVSTKSRSDGTLTTRAALALAKGQVNRARDVAKRHSERGLVDMPQTKKVEIVTISQPEPPKQEEPAPVVVEVVTEPEVPVTLPQTPGHVPFTFLETVSDDLEALWQLQVPKDLKRETVVWLVCSTWLEIVPGHHMPRDEFLAVFYRRMREGRMPQSDLEVNVLQFVENELRQKVERCPSLLPVVTGTSGKSANVPPLKPVLRNERVCWPHVRMREIPPNMWVDALGRFSATPSMRTAEELSEEYGWFIPPSAFALASLCEQNVATTVSSESAEIREFMENRESFVTHAERTASDLPIAQDDAPWLCGKNPVEPLYDVPPQENEPTAVSQPLSIGPPEAKISVRCSQPWLAWDFFETDSSLTSPPTRYFWFVVDLPGLDPDGSDFQVDTDDVAQVVLHGEYKDRWRLDADSVFVQLLPVGKFSLEINVPEAYDLGQLDQFWEEGVLSLKFPGKRTLV